MQISLIEAAYAIYTVLPAYFANATPTVLGGGTPIDLGRAFVDGRRVLGPGKTMRGFVSGLIVGTTVGLLQKALFPGFLLTLGALLGDLAGSFIKRRLDIAPGFPFPLLDQLSFVAGALSLNTLFFPLDIATVFYVALLTPLIHVLTNTVAYLLRLKDAPW